MTDYEKYLEEEREEIRRRYEEERRRMRAEREEAAGWNESYLRTLGMSMSDFL